MTERVTIVTSVLNAAGPLPQCLHSVAGQTYPCDHIIVDGGSTDGSQSVVADFAKTAENPRQAKLVEAPGTGISEAWNVGVSEASGDIIGILNADDWYEPDTVERTVQVLNEHREAGFSYGAVMMHGAQGKTRVAPVAADKMYYAARRFMPFGHISSFVRRHVFEQYGSFDPSRPVAMDFDFYARIVSAGVTGVEVPGILGHAYAADHELGGGNSGQTWSRSVDTFEVSRKYIGTLPALYTVSKYAARVSLFDILHRSKLGRAVLRGRPRARFTLIEEE